MVFPDAAGVLVVVLVVVVDEVCGVPPLVEAGVDEVVVDAVLLVVVAAEVAAVVLEVVRTVDVDPVEPTDTAVPLVPVGPRLSSGLVIVGEIVGELVGTSSENLRAAARGEHEAAHRHGPHEPRPHWGNGGIRRPQVGQSLRSRWASWRHHGQKRRFSIDQGSREREGFSGSTRPTTSSVSPVSWST